jgi:DNA-binding beta-propeller fold protein YncE
MKKTYLVHVAFFLCSIGHSQIHAGEIMAVGLDRKFTFDDKGQRKALAPGKDEVLFYDISAPNLKPRLMGSLPLENSIVGPPTNIAITPNQQLALVASSFKSERTADNAAWKFVPSDELFVVDLSDYKPKLINTIKVGRQPSGIGINKQGSLAVVANRDEKSLSVLSIQGSNVTLIQTLAISDGPGSVAFTPDGKRVVVTRPAAHKISLFDISDANQLSLNSEHWVGLFPWAVSVTNDGKQALVTNIGNGASSDGGAKTVSVLDLAAAPPRIVRHISVGDAPEGIAITPKGDAAFVSILQGSFDAPKGAWFANPNGKLTILRKKNGMFEAAESVDVGGFPEGVGISYSGEVVYVGNYSTNSISILAKNKQGKWVVRETMELPGPPASLRIGSQ